MSDTLVVSGGGRITMASADLIESADRCRVLSARLELVAADLRAVLPPPEGVGAAFRAEGLADRLRVTGALLTAALDAYSMAELLSTRAAEVAAGQVAYWGAAVAPGLLALIPLPMLLLIGGWLAAGAPGVPRDEVAAQLEGARRLLSDPRAVAAVRLLAGSVDDGIRGAAHVPWELSQQTDDFGTGALGHEAAARDLLGGLALAGRVPGGSIAVTRTAREPVSPPRSLADLASRIPAASAGAPQVRIERYDHAVAVYLGGTVDLGAGPDSEPWDLTSDLQAMAGVPAGSAEATAEALRAAGVGSDEPVVLVGYSQGGIVASRLAASGVVPVAGLVTLGSPGGAVRTPQGIPVLALEHREDLVPALSGVRTYFPERVTVSRSLYDGHLPDSPKAVPAHELVAYQETAALADRTQEARVTGARDAVLAPFAASGDGEATDWRAVRTE